MFFFDDSVRGIGDRNVAIVMHASMSYDTYTNYFLNATRGTNDDGKIFANSIFNDYFEDTFKHHINQSIGGKISGFDGFEPEIFSMTIEDVELIDIANNITLQSSAAFTNVPTTTKTVATNVTDISTGSPTKQELPITTMHSTSILTNTPSPERKKGFIWRYLTLKWILIAISVVIATASICAAVFGAVVQKRREYTIQRQAQAQLRQIQSVSPEPENDGQEPIVLSLPVVFSANVPDNVERKSAKSQNNYNINPSMNANQTEPNSDQEHDSEDINESASDLFIEYDDRKDINTDNYNHTQQTSDHDVANTDIEIDNTHYHHGQDHIDEYGEGEQEPIESRKFSTHSKRSTRSTIQMISIVDESNFQEWTNKHVLIWLKVLLQRAKFEKIVVKTFLKEFNKIQVTGITLKKYKENMELIHELKKQFPQNSQIDPIWQEIEAAIKVLGTNDRKVTATRRQVEEGIDDHNKTGL